MRDETTTSRPHRLRRWSSVACGALALLASSCSGNNGPTGIIPGMALGKLCHQLNRGGQPVTLTLQVGDDVHFTRISAVTGTCSPPTTSPCATIPVGLVTLKLFEADRVIFARQAILHDGDEYIFQPGVNPADGTLGIGGGPVLKGRCMIDDFLPDDGGVDGAVDALASEAGASEAGLGDGGVPDVAPTVPDAGAPDAAADAPAPTDATESIDAGPDGAADAAPADADTTDATDTASTD